MAKRTKIQLQGRGIRDLLHDDGLANHLQGLGDRVEQIARSDPNPKYRESIRVTVHHSDGSRSRVSVRIGAMPYLGTAVEARRGTLQRALGSL